MPVTAAIIGGVSTGAQMIMSGIQQRKARLGLEELQKQPFPEIAVAPELQSAYGQAQAISQYGFSPEQTAAFNERLARTQGTAFQSAIDLSGGQMAGALSGGLQSQKIGAIGQFAEAGAGLQLKKIQYAGDIASQIQAIKQANAQAKIQQRMMLEQAYGQAIKQQKENVMAGVGSLGAIGTQAVLSAQYGGTGQKTTGGQPFTLPPTAPGLGFGSEMGGLGSTYGLTPSETPFTPPTIQGTPISEEEYQQFLQQNK